MSYPLSSLSSLSSPRDARAASVGRPLPWPLETFSQLQSVNRGPPKALQHTRELSDREDFAINLHRNRRHIEDMSLRPSPRPVSPAVTRGSHSCALVPAQRPVARSGECLLVSGPVQQDPVAAALVSHLHPLKSILHGIALERPL